MNSWANLAVADGRDLHLDLRTAIAPGTRGARETLLGALRDAVRSGRLPPGTRLPSSRTLAADLGLARNTVTEAYADLVAEGWLAARQGAGTWVPRTPTAGPAPSPRNPARRAAGEPTHDLMPGSPDVSAFPRAAWLAATRRALNGAPHAALRLGDPRGPVALREALAEYLARTRGVRTTAETVVVCAGTRDAVRILGQAVDGPIAAEAQGLFLFRDALAAVGVPTVPIDVDDDGAVVAQLDDPDKRDVRAVLLTPAHHFPRGVALHPARRTAVLDWARRGGGHVLEDDYDGEFRYDRQPVGAVQGLDPDRVVYLGSASKSLAPALRLGWMVVPDALLDRVLAAAGWAQFHVNAIGALTMAEFIADGGYDKHVRRMRLVYRRRRDRLVTALAPFAVGIGGLAAGLHLQLTVPAGREPELLRRCADAGLALAPLSQANHPAAGPNTERPEGLIVSFGTPPEHGFAGAVRALCGVLEAAGLAH